MKYFIRILAALALVAGCSVTVKAQRTSDREARLLVIEGNKLFNQEKYSEAEEKYRKALELKPTYDFARYNLASSLLKQAPAMQSAESQANDIANQALQIFNDLSTNAETPQITELASYNAGNMLFNAQQYAQSIEMYKRSLRVNPDNDLARENLRLAQLMLEQQQNQDQNKDQNQDQNQDQQNQDQNKDQQDQNQNQNQDQQNQDQNKDKEKTQQPQQPQQQQQNITDQNAEAILKTMQNKENETRKRIEERKKKEMPGRQRPITNPW